MTTVNIQQAKTQLSRLLAAVEAGEEVVIVRNGSPVARLVKYERRGKRRFGARAGRIAVDDSFFDPHSGGGVVRLGGMSSVRRVW